MKPASEKGQYKLMRKTTTCWLGLGLGLLCAAPAHASTTFIDFNSDPVAAGLVTSITGTGSDGGQWTPNDGIGSATNSSDGYLQITDAVNSQRGVVIFPDFDAGAVVQAFSFDCWVRIGNGVPSSTPPADGFSIAYVRANDPVLSGGSFAEGPDSESNMPEEGTTTGISVGFDAYANGGSPPWPPDQLPGLTGNIVGIDVRVDGMLILQYPMPTLNGTVTDPTSIQTGANDGTGSPDSLGWAHLVVSLDTNALLNVYYKGAHILTNYATGFSPGPGQLVLAGRTGGYNENQDVDNITITTILAKLAVIGPPTGLPDGATVVINDSGSSLVNVTKPFSMMINGVTAAATIQKSGSVTTVAGHLYPSLLVPGATNTVVISVQDTHGNTDSVTRTFVTAPYTVVQGAWAASGVGTQPGFRILPWQSGAEPNRVYWMEEQLEGLHGANDADVSTATDGGFINFTGLINFNLDPNGGQEGDFTTTTGYTDSPFPGLSIAGGAGSIPDTGSESMMVLAFLQFAKAGVYNMGVNSDDGFAVTVGPQPRDRLAAVAGQYDTGRGSADTTFWLVVTNAGTYPFCLRYENGNGSFTGGNAANLEWFTVQPDGTKILINDPSSTNTSGVKAFYSGPAPTAYVSQINPYLGQPNAWPDRVVVQLTDAATQVKTTPSPALLIDGVATTPVVSKQGAVTTLLLTLPPPGLSPGQHTATVVWSDTGTLNASNSWSFTVAGPFPTLDQRMGAPVSSVDKTKPGFVLKVTQLDPGTVGDSGNVTGDNVEENNAHLAGLYFPDYGTNQADTVGGGASGIPAAFDNIWDWTNAVDFNILTSPGDFTFDYALPGIPGNTSATSWIAAGFQTYVVFPTAGFYRMGVNSDNGFRITQGIGITRQVLHVTGPGIDQDMVGVVNATNTAAGWGGSLPTTPLIAPAVFLDSSNACPGYPSANLTNKIGIIEYNTCGHNALQAAWCVQTNGGMAAIIINQPAYGLPFTEGDSGLPVTIPALVVNGRSADGGSGAFDFWRTNSLIVNICADARLKLLEYNAVKSSGMSDVDSGFWVPAAGAYPLRLLYFQGNGGAGCEWSTILPAVTVDGGARSLVNDTTDANSLRSYRAVTVLPKMNTPTVSNGMVTVTWNGAGFLQSTTSLSPASWANVVPQPGANTYTTAASGTQYYRVRVPDPVTP